MKKPRRRRRSSGVRPSALEVEFRSSIVCLYTMEWRTRDVCMAVVQLMTRVQMKPPMNVSAMKHALSTLLVGFPACGCTMMEAATCRVTRYDPKALSSSSPSSVPIHHVSQLSLQSTGPSWSPHGASQEEPMRPRMQLIQWAATHTMNKSWYCVIFRYE